MIYVTIASRNRWTIDVQCNIFPFPLNGRQGKRVDFLIGFAIVARRYGEKNDDSADRPFRAGRLGAFCLCRRWFRPLRRAHAIRRFSQGGGAGPDRHRGRAPVGLRERGGSRPARVVHIGTLQVARAGGPDDPGPRATIRSQGLLRPVLRRGPGRREEFQTPGLGSGVIVDKRGYVLTNFHVVRGPTR